MAFPGERTPLLPGSVRARLEAWLCGVLGCLVLVACAASAASLLTWSNADPSFTHATSGPTRNLLGPVGAIVADLIMQLFGLAGPFIILPPAFWALQLIANGRLGDARIRLAAAPLAVALLACAASSLPKVGGWPLPYNLGGFVGDQVSRLLTGMLGAVNPERASAAAGLFCFAGGVMLLMKSLGVSQQDLKQICGRPRHSGLGSMVGRWWQGLADVADRSIAVRREPTLRMPSPLPAFHRTEPMLGPELRMIPAERSHVAPPIQEPSNLRSGRGAASDDTEGRQARKMAERFAFKKGERTPAPPAVGVDPPSLPDAPDCVPEADDEGDEWPPPAGAEPPATARRMHSRRGGDELYGRAVAIVLGDRRASNEYLQQRLAIGYMLAADLIERMEREGILGAPVYNGMRPILVSRPGAQEV